MAPQPWTSSTEPKVGSFSSFSLPANRRIIIKKAGRTPPRATRFFPP
jgi:hypothetical protein